MMRETRLVRLESLQALALCFSPTESKWQIPFLSSNNSTLPYPNNAWCISYFGACKFRSAQISPLNLNRGLDIMHSFSPPEFMHLMIYTIILPFIHIYIYILAICIFFVLLLTYESESGHSQCDPKGFDDCWNNVTAMNSTVLSRNCHIWYYYGNKINC